MIEIFGSQAPTGGAGSNPQQLAHGISVALYNTAFGLIVAIPALMFYRYFRGRVDEFQLAMELAAERMVPHLMRFTCQAGLATPRLTRPAMKFSRRRPDEPEINLIPFIDVLLVVLIFLMLSTTYSRFTELQVNLPAADAEKLRERPAEIIVSVAADGRYAVNRQPVDGRSVELLTAELVQAAGAARRRHRWSSSRPTPLAAHQSVVNVLDAARRAGLPA
jgi:biopolymer transport protein ExbD